MYWRRLTSRGLIAICPKYAARWSLIHRFHHSSRLLTSGDQIRFKGLNKNFASLPPKDWSEMLAHLDLCLLQRSLLLRSKLWRSI
jgi:hypothetical protein